MTLANGDSARFRYGRYSMHATISTSDLNFPLAGRFLEHFREALPCR